MVSFAAASIFAIRAANDFRLSSVQKNFRSDELNKEIVVIQTSVEELELAPEMAGKTRATLTVSGWQLL